MARGIPPGSGVVIAETLNNGSRITGHIERWKELILWRQNHPGEDNTQWISALDQSLSTQAFMGVVPAGTYRIGLLYTQKRVGNALVSARAQVPPALGAFEVQAGQVTNLGTIVYHPFQARHRAQDAYPDYALTRVANDDLVRLAHTLHPELMAQIDSATPVLGWLEDPHDEVRHEAASLIKQAALPTGMHLLRGGRQLLTGLNGALYSLEDGQWQNRSLTHHYQITDLVELPSGELLIGSEFGNLSIGQLNGTLQDIPMDNRPRHVIDLVSSNAGGAYLVSDVIDSYEIHQFAPSSRSISLLKAFPKLTTGLLQQVERPGPAVLGTKNGIAIFVDKQVHRFHEASASWSTDDAVEFHALHKQPNGSVTGIPYGALTGAKPMQYSEDGGLTWNATQAEGGLLAHLVHKKPSYRFADGEIIRPGRDERFRWRTGIFEMSDAAPIMSTADDGATWEEIGSVPPGCLDMAVEASTDDRVHILCDDGRLIVSDDRGRSWQDAQGGREVPEFEDFPAPLKFRFERETEM